MRVDFDRRWWRLGTIAAAAAATAAVATVVIWGVNAVAQERPERGVPLRFWQGHFNRSSEPFHEWDKVAEIPAVCARCHGANSVPEYLRDGKTAAAPHVQNGFACSNCHADMLTYARHTVSKVTFPSGATVESGNNDTNLCMTCHQGIESAVSVNKAIADLPLDTPDPKLSFVHAHYFPAGAMMFGTQSKVGYEYPGKTYAGRFAHMPNVSTCTGCHQPHTGEVKIDRCGGCHAGVRELADIAGIRMATRGDLDGNGKEEGMVREIAGLEAQLYAAIQTYAKTVGGKSLAFTRVLYPYWYTDLNDNGRIDPEEIRPDNKYTAYTPRLMQAIFNYTFVLRDPGAAIHNGRYSAQILYDSLESLAASGKAGVTMAGKVRP
jgi:hypothetical protein